MDKRSKRLTIMIMLIALTLTTACTTGIDAASDATKMPPPTLTETPEQAPAPYQADMVHTEKLDTMVDVLELYYKKNEFSDMENDEYNEILASIDPDFICNYEGVGRVGENLTYIVATRKERGSAELDISKEHFARFRGDVRYVKSFDLLIVRPYRDDLHGVGSYEWDSGIRDYLHDKSLCMDKIKRKQQYGISYSGYDNDYNILVGNLGYGGDACIYIHDDFDFEAFYEEVNNHAETHEKCSYYNELIVGVYNSDLDLDIRSIHFGLSDKGEKVVDGYVNEELFDKVMDKVSSLAGFKYHIKDEITDITSATLRANGKKYTVTDTDTLNKLELMIQRSRKTDFDHLCLPNGTITLTCQGKHVTLYLEGTIFSIGSGCIYMCRSNDNFRELFDVDKDDFYVDIDEYNKEQDEIADDIVTIKTCD